MTDYVRHNHFFGYSKLTQEDKKNSWHREWDWDLCGLVENGKILSFSKFKNRPDIYGPLIDTLWKVDIECIPPCSFATVRMHRYFLSIFEVYLTTNENNFLGDLHCLYDIRRENLIDYRRWCFEKYRNSTARKAYRLFSSLLKVLQKDEFLSKDIVRKDLEIPIKSLANSSDDDSKTNPYTINEAEDIVEACKREINMILVRLKKGEDYLKDGQDPRITNKLSDGIEKRSNGYENWYSIPNILWYIVNVLKGKMPSRYHADAAPDALQIFLNRPDPRTPIRKMEAYKLLYPTSNDLVPFILLLSMKTGLNPESLLMLKRNCLLGKMQTMTTVQFCKNRGSHDVMTRQFSHRGSTSPVGIIKTILQMTEILVPLASPDLMDELWLCQQMDLGNATGVGKQFSSKIAVPSQRYIRLQINGRNYSSNSSDSNTSKNSNLIGFMRRNGIKNRDGEDLIFTFQAARKTESSSKYIKHGNIENISRRTLKHHGKHGLNTTAIHYLTNEATHHVHNRVIRDAQDKAVAEARHVINAGEDIKVSELKILSKELSESEEKIISFLKGEQDVFIAVCRDFYNKPGGPLNSPCSDPWQCFSCANALWTSRILPRLINFLEFINNQRKILDPIDWDNKFGFPYDAIVKDILPRFNTRIIEWAKAEAKQTPFYVPPYLKGV